MNTIEKICTRCGKNKLLSEFSDYNKRGHARKESRCKVCRNEVEKERRCSPEVKAHKKEYDALYRQTHPEECRAQKQARKKEAQEIMRGYKCAPCIDCGIEYPPQCMEFDHISGEKKDDVSRMVLGKKEDIVREIEKCEVVCANCHRIRTQERMEPTKEKRSLAHREMVNKYKSVPCMDCGETFPPIAMDLDHVRGEKVAGISRMQHYPRWKVLEELAKCEAICANCHRIRTEKRRMEQNNNT